MAFIGESRVTEMSPWKIYVCLSADDCKVLSNVIGSLVARKLRTFEYYDGIHQSGEATDKQIEKLEQAREELSTAEDIEEVVRKYIKLKGL